MNICVYMSSAITLNSEIDTFYFGNLANCYLVSVTAGRPELFQFFISVKAAFGNKGESGSAFKRE